MRKAFNFYRSFYDVYKELSTKDKELFMDALLDRQFNGTEPTNLKGMAMFAFKSQEQVINSQIEGYEYKTGAKLGGSIGGKEGAKQGASVQVQEKGEVQGKEEEEVEGIDFMFFWDLYDKKVGSKSNCEKKWNKLSYELQSKILHHVEEYVKSTPDKKFRCNPEVYFNQQRWENEIINYDNNGKSKQSFSQQANEFLRNNDPDYDKY